MSSFYLRDYVAITNGRCNGRSVLQSLVNGRVTVSGTDKDGARFSRTVIIEDGEIVDNRLYDDCRKLAHRILYGKFESSVTPAGREITRFNPRTGKGKHGKSKRREELSGNPGWCHSWYKVGRLVRQKFRYDNGVIAYDWTGGRENEIKDPDGRVVFQLTGAISSAQQWQGTGLFRRPMEDWFKTDVPFSVRKNGRVIYAGQYANRQQVGEWVIGGVKHYFEHGVAIPKKLFHTPAEKLDPRELLKIGNAQLRMAMLAKADFNAKRLAELGKVIHSDGAMRLFDVKGLETRILRVQCPSTKSYYFINVPKDSVRCEEARQWTFHVGAGVAAPIKFTVET